MFDDVTGTRNRETMVMGSPIGGAVVFTIQSAQDDDWKKATFDTLSDAAKRQLSGTRAGFLLASLDSLDAEQLRSIWPPSPRLGEHAIKDTRRRQPVDGDEGSAK
jgi:hypothetical protein